MRKEKLKNNSTEKNNISVRLDKWLWVARFYKTRSLATQAIKNGRVHVNNQRSKPGKIVEINQIIKINKSSYITEIKILHTSNTRKNFEIAQTLYQETPLSLETKAREAVLRKLANQGITKPKNKPNKKERRQLQQVSSKYTSN